MSVTFQANGGANVRSPLVALHSDKEFFIAADGEDGEGGYRCCMRALPGHQGWQEGVNGHLAERTRLKRTG
jgi:hypothetical protein